jgi:hypothetical protein
VRCENYAVFFLRRAPPRCRSCTPDSVKTRCTNPYERPVEDASARMLSPDVYRLTRSFASVARSAPTIRRPFSVVVAVLVAAISKSLTSYSGRFKWNTTSSEVMFPVSPIRPSSTIMR